jgi:thiol-disulfide isomerase/thioredoxin
MNSMDQLRRPGNGFRISGALFVLGSLLLLGMTCRQNVMGQEAAATVQDQTDSVQTPEFAAFVEWLKNAEQIAQKSPAWRLSVDTTLATGEEDSTTAELHLTLDWRSPSFRLDVREKDAPHYFALYHEGSLLRYSPTAQKFSRQTTLDPLHEMPTCGLTHGYLDQAGVPFLLTLNPSSVVLNNLSHVSDLGVDDAGRHFSVTYHDGHRGEWWFMPEGPRLPIAIQIEKEISLAEGREVSWSRTAKLTWDLAPMVDEAAWSFQVPGDAQQVEDLTASVSGQGTEVLVGQQLPKLNLTDLQLQAVPDNEITQPTLLYFWATWAAPSIEQIPDILKFAEQLESRGVKIQAINVADSPDRVQQFLAANQIQTTVYLDQEGDAAHSLRLTELPAVVVVGADQKILALFQSVTAESRPAILSAIEKVLPERK